MNDDAPVQKKCLPDGSRRCAAVPALADGTRGAANPAGRPRAARVTRVLVRPRSARFPRHRTAWPRQPGSTCCPVQSSSAACDGTLQWSVECVYRVPTSIPTQDRAALAYVAWDFLVVGSSSDVPSGRAGRCALPRRWAPGVYVWKVESPAHCHFLFCFKLNKKKRGKSFSPYN
jgi:hypothetical protein